MAQFINREYLGDLHDKRPSFDEFLDKLGSNMEKQQKMTKQEENWMLMTTLQIPWKDADSIDNESDRKFLLTKVKEVQGYLKEQEAQMKAQQEAMMSQAGMQKQPSNIITPADMGV